MRGAFLLRKRPFHAIQPLLQYVQIVGPGNWFELCSGRIQPVQLRVAPCFAPDQHRLYQRGMGGGAAPTFEATGIFLEIVFLRIIDKGFRHAYCI